MRKFFLPTVFFSFFICIILFFSCRKADTDQQNEIQNIKEDRFFSGSSSSFPQVQAIAQSIKQQNEKMPFLSSVIEKAGYPRWDKARIVHLKDASVLGRGNNQLDTGEVVYIPFVLDSQSRVNAVLSVKLENTDTAYSILYASRYKMFGYDTTDHSKWNAKDAFNFFVSFDYSVFGHTKFLIQDDSLFKRQLDTSFIVVTLTDVNGQDVLARNNVLSAEVCISYTYCETAGAPCVAPSSGPSPASGGTNCSLLAARTTNSNCRTTTSCTTYYFDDEGGWIGGPVVTTGGGSGGGTPGWTEGQSCPSARTAKTAPGVGCIPGWIPVVTTEQLLAQHLTVVLGLSIEQQNWLVAHPNISTQVNNYLNNTSQTGNVALTNATDHINMLMTNNDYYNFVMNHMQTTTIPLSVWWEDNTWLSNSSNFNFDLDPTVNNQYDELTAEEKRLVAVNPKAAIIISNNVQKAFNMTAAKFPSTTPHSGHNDKADAFRHAYFQAINVRDITPNGITITTAFANAHESETPTQLQLEKQMDLHNNSVGITIADNQTLNGLFTSDNEFANLVMTAVTNGDTKYLKPLNHGDPYWSIGPDGTKKTATNGIISSTALVPTNQ